MHGADVRIGETAVDVFSARRRALVALHGEPALLVSGGKVPRNYPGNVYRFRALSHFLYFVGRPVDGAALLFRDGKTTLFTEPPDDDDALWHGPRPSLDEVEASLGVDAARPISELAAELAPIRNRVGTIPAQDAATAAWVSSLLGRDVAVGTGDSLDDTAPDAKLADALIALRLTHDDAALTRMRETARVSARAHLAGMRRTKPGMSEAEILAAMIGELRRFGLDDAYGPIVTVHGEVLHNTTYENVASAGDLLLADLGGEHPEGWAADITRVWPVSGTFSATQRAVYEVVLASQRAAIDRVRSGVRYREVHDTAKRVLVEGLVELGIFRGSVDGLLERGAAAVFFPHGVGHLLGLDVHDMEDLGDRAGYAPGRQRSSAFGDRFLRLDRDLAAGMAVTVEPGFYQVPAILQNDAYVGVLGADFDRDVLAKYADVRGIRIEDDVVVTEGEPEVLTESVPKDADEVERVMRG